MCATNFNTLRPRKLFVLLPQALLHRPPGGGLDQKEDGGDKLQPRRRVLRRRPDGHVVRRVMSVRCGQPRPSSLFRWRNSSFVTEARRYSALPRSFTIQCWPWYCGLPVMPIGNGGRDIAPRSVDACALCETESVFVRGPQWVGTLARDTSRRLVAKTIAEHFSQ